MRVKVLGSAAGGGFPQWNCACSNCQRVRQNAFRGQARTQAQIAASSDGDSWWLLNASPDLRFQLENTPELHPRRAPRDTPVAGVVLTSGDLDHVLGLLLLREFQPLRVYGTPALKSILMDSNSVFRMLFSGQRALVWSDLLPGDAVELRDVAGQRSGIVIEGIPLLGNFPRYAEANEAINLPQEEAVIGLTISTRNGDVQATKRMIYAPGLAKVDDTVLSAFDSADLLFVDGTFWSEDELCATAGRTASQMGHLAISGAHGSLKSLANLKTPRKVFIHINNTNPILDEESPQYREVRAAGWEVARDGTEFTL